MKDWLKRRWLVVIQVGSVLVLLGCVIAYLLSGSVTRAETKPHPVANWPKGEYDEPRMPYATDIFVHGYDVEMRASNTVYIDTRIFAAYSNVSIVVVREDGSVWQTGNARKVRAENGKVIVE